MSDARVTLWSWVVWSGVAVILLTIVIAQVFPKTGGDFAPGYAVPVYAFEFARSKEDLPLVFGEKNDLERPARVRQMDRGNYWDFAFMTAYAAFLACFFWSAARATGRRNWRIVALLVGLSGPCDAIENAILLSITRDLDTAAGLPWLWLPVTLKFSLLLFGAAAAGCFFWRHATGVWRRLGHGLIVLALIGVAGLIVPERFAYLLAVCIAPAWLAQFVFAWRQRGQ
ncbi:MAG: hypothetical protein AAF290_02860 [Pseudomonadota bacterium]